MAAIEEDRRPHAAYLHSGLIVVINGPTAALLDHVVQAQRLDRRALPSQVREQLTAIADAAVRYRGAVGRDVVPPSPTIGTAEAAELLGVSPRRVRQLAAEGRLPAEFDRGSWCIRADDLEEYLANMPARKEAA